MELTDMKYPWMRDELLDYLTGLSDPAYQQACWVEGQCPEGTAHDEFDYAIHFLFDDTELGSNPKSCIGLFLKNDKEAACIGKVCGAIDTILEKHGTELSDAQYTALPDWQNVIQSAQNALHILKAAGATS